MQTVRYKVSSPPQCSGTKADGSPCRGHAKHGFVLCGPHLDKVAADALRPFRRDAARPVTVRG